MPPALREIKKEFIGAFGASARKRAIFYFYFFHLAGGTEKISRGGVVGEPLKFP